MLLQYERSRKKDEGREQGTLALSPLQVLVQLFDPSAKQLATFTDSGLVVAQVEKTAAATHAVHQPKG